jgi:hypothetical protein
MILIYTVCTGNFLGHAISLHRSISKNHQNFKFIACVVDSREHLKDLIIDLEFEVLFADEIDIEEIKTLSSKYNIHELTCAYKPIFGEYLLENYTKTVELWYFDGDMLVFNDLNVVSDELSENSILITPHFFTGYNDKLHQSERDFLNSGLYNAGFFAIKNDSIGKDFLKWWATKTKNEGYLRYDLGMGSDQLWFNFIPLFFEKVKISKHLGFNVAYWNLHERKISLTHGKFIVNETLDLVFYHFSGYNPAKANEISRHQNRFTFDNSPNLETIFSTYRNSLIESNTSSFETIQSKYNNKFFKKTISEKLKAFSTKIILYFLWKGIKLFSKEPVI